jgi:hypothetical protein
MAFAATLKFLISVPFHVWGEGKTAGPFTDNSILFVMQHLLPMSVFEVFFCKFSSNFYGRFYFR